MLLSDLEVSEHAKILKVSSDDSMKRRLYDLGFFPGMNVECVLKSPFSSPILYCVRGSFIALRESDAKRIEVLYEE